MRQTVSPLMYAWAWADRDAGITGPSEAGAAAAAPLQGERRRGHHETPVVDISRPCYHALTFSDRCKSIPPSRLLPERSTGQLRRTRWRPRVPSRW